MNQAKKQPQAAQKKQNGQNQQKRKPQNNKPQPLSRPPTGFRTMTAPAAMGFSLPQSSFEVNRGPRPDSLRARGRDYLGSVVTGATAPVLGQVLRNDFISPSAGFFNGTRLQKFSTLYEKYVFRKCKFYYVPEAATSYAGMIGMAFDKDYADSTPPTGEDGIRQYLGFQNAVTGTLWAPMELDVKLTDMQDFYYCNDTGYDGRLVYQGQLYIFAGSPLNSTSRYGSVFVEYEIDFFDPQIENPLDYSTMYNNNPTVPVTANAGWNQLTNIVTGIGKVVTDSSGNKGIELPPGTYVCEQDFSSASLVTNWLQPVGVAVNNLSTAAIANLIASAGSANGYNRVDKVTVTGGPMRFFGNIAVGANLSGALVRWLQTTASGF